MCYFTCLVQVSVHRRVQTTDLDWPAIGLSHQYRAGGLGDAWSLLIVRDLMFKGLVTFQKFAGRVKALPQMCWWTGWRDWSAGYDETGAPPETLRAMSRDRRRFLARVRQQWEKGAVDFDTPRST